MTNRGVRAHLTPLYVFKTVIKMNKVIKKAEKIAKDAAQKLGLEIISVDLVCEHGMKILRIIADREFGLTIEDSEQLNLEIGAALDVDDIMDEEYYLEVSSVGAERLLNTDREITHAIGRYVCVKTVKDEFIGDLVDSNDEYVLLRINNKGRMSNKEIKKADIKEIRLALKF